MFKLRKERIIEQSKWSDSKFRDMLTQRGIELQEESDRRQSVESYRMYILNVGDPVETKAKKKETNSLPF